MAGQLATVSSFVILLFLFSAPRSSSPSLAGPVTIPKGVNGGVYCLACTAVVALTEQLSVIHNETFVKSYDRLCNILPIFYRNACIALGQFYIPLVIDLLTDKVTADVVCHGTHLCYEDKGQPYCHAFPPRGDFQEKIVRSRERVTAKLFQGSASKSKSPAGFDPCALAGVKELCKLFKRVFTNDLPLFDWDNDTYSPSVESWRGTSWRGRDCGDSNALHHPGAKPEDGDVVSDSNCNGIHGTDSITGKSLEDMFCKGWLFYSYLHEYRATFCGLLDKRSVVMKACSLRGDNL